MLVSSHSMNLMKWVARSNCLSKKAADPLPTQTYNEVAHKQAVEEEKKTEPKNIKKFDSLPCFKTKVAIAKDKIDEMLNLGDHLVALELYHVLLDHKFKLKNIVLIDCFEGSCRICHALVLAPCGHSHQPVANRTFGGDSTSLYTRL